MGRRGTRPRQPADQRYDNAYLFGAICPARSVGAALALPYADTNMMQLHLDEISRNVAEGAQAVLLLDRAGWHTTGKLDVPKNITPIFLPSRAPELNPVENVWQYLRQNWLSNTVFENYDAILDAATHGEGSSLNPKPSHPSECETGRTSVSRYDLWYQIAPGRTRRASRRSSGLASLGQTHRAAQHHADRLAGTMPRAEPAGKRMAVHARKRNPPA